MAAGNAVIAHDNPYNRWVAGDGALYFRDVAEADARITTCSTTPSARAELGDGRRARVTRRSSPGSTSPVSTRSCSLAVLDSSRARRRRGSRTPEEIA